MADNPFHHDAAAFDPIEVPTGVNVDEAEAKYADLFAEVIWDGVITAEKRDRLKTAATTFGLAPIPAAAHFSSWSVSAWCRSILLAALAVPACNAGVRRER